MKPDDWEAPENTEKMFLALKLFNFNISISNFKNIKKYQIRNFWSCPQLLSKGRNFSEAFTRNFECLKARKVVSSAGVKRTMFFNVSSASVPHMFFVFSVLRPMGANYSSCLKNCFVGKVFRCDGRRERHFPFCSYLCVLNPKMNGCRLEDTTSRLL